MTLREDREERVRPQRNEPSFAERKERSRRVCVACADLKARSERNRERGESLDADYGHELERTPLLRAEGRQERRFQQKRKHATPRPNLLLDIGMSPTLATFAEAMPDGSQPLATKESDLASSNKTDWRPSSEDDAVPRVLSPVLAEAAMEGRLPRGFCVKRLTDLPMLWSEQWRALGLQAPIQLQAEPS